MYIFYVLTTFAPKTFQWTEICLNLIKGNRNKDKVSNNSNSNKKYGKDC